MRSPLGDLIDNRGQSAPSDVERKIAGGVTEPSGDGATHAYLSKGHDRPVRGWHGPLPLRGGWSGIPPPGDAGGTGKYARGVTATSSGGRRVPLLTVSYCQI